MKKTFKLALASSVLLTNLANTMPAGQIIFAQSNDIIFENYATQWTNETISILCRLSEEKQEEGYSFVESKYLTMNSDGSATLTITENGTFSVVAALEEEQIKREIVVDYIDKTQPTAGDLSLYLNNNNEAEIKVINMSDETNGSGIHKFVLYKVVEDSEDKLIEENDIGIFTSVTSGEYYVSVYDAAGNKADTETIIISDTLDISGLVFQCDTATTLTKEKILYYKWEEGTQPETINQLTYTLKKDDTIIEGFRVYEGGEYTLEVSDGIHTKSKTITLKENYFDPNAPIINASEIIKWEEGATNSGGKVSVKIDANDASDSISYAKDGENYQDSNVLEYNVDQNKTYYYFVKDAFDNTGSGSFVIDNIDTKVPVIDSIKEEITGNWVQKQKLTVQAHDEYSDGYNEKYYGLSTIEYVKSNTKLVDFNNVEWKSLENSTLDINENGYYYFRVKDHAGNYSDIYEKHIDNIDTVQPKITSLQLLQSNTKEEIAFNNEYTAENILIKIAANDFLSEETTSSESAISKVEYSFNDGEWIQLEDIKKAEDGSFISSLEANKNGVYSFRVYDEAGNLSETSSITIDKIDKEAPEVSLAFDYNETDSIYKSFYNQKRKATITVSDYCFDASLISIKVKKDGEEIPTSIEWIENDTKEKMYEGVISFEADGDYEIEISGKDKAGNAFKKITDNFTIDLTNPIVDVTYDNNISNKDLYFGAVRTATVTVKEKNFDKERVSIIGTAINGEEKMEFPLLSSWSHDKDTHTATIAYLNDAQYTFHIEVMDKAGRVSDSYNTDHFIIDTTKPVINSVTYEKWKDTATNKGGQVSLTIEATDLHGPLQYSSDDTTYQENNVLKYMILENGTYSYFIKDVAGNTVSKDFVVDNIDVEKPIIDSIKEETVGKWTKQQTLTIIAHDEYSDGYNEKYHGIETIEYIRSNTKLNTFEDLKWQIVSDNSVTINKNGYYYFRVKDYAGNYSEVSEKRIGNVDATNPTIKNITLYQNLNEKEEVYDHQYTNKDITIKVVSADTMDSLATLEENGIAKIQYKVNDEKWMDLQTPTKQEDGTYLSSLTVQENGEYHFRVYDKTGNISEESSVKINKIDKDSPVFIKADESLKENQVIYVEKMENPDVDPVQKKEYGTFSNGSLKVVVKAEDVSGIRDIVLSGKSLKDNKDITIHSISKTTQGTTGTYVFEIPLDKDGYVTGTYTVKVYDNTTGIVDTKANVSGNFLEISLSEVNTNISGKESIIAIEKMAPQITNLMAMKNSEAYPLRNTNYLYDHNGSFHFSVSDLDMEESAGLNKVKVTVTNDTGVNTTVSIPIEETYTASSFSSIIRKKAFEIKDVYQDGKITLHVEAIDNALNKTEKKLELYKDTKAPVVSLRFDNVESDATYSSYYDAARIAIITVVERTFDESLMNVSITKNNKQITLPVSWQKIGVNETGEGIYEGRVTFESDGDYTLSVNGSDKVGHASNTVSENFTIDLTNPVVSVDYDNNHAFNEIYYQDYRTATITIKETNFDPSRVRIIGSATDNGATKEFPTLSGWSSNGDHHSATIKYDKDAHYTFDIEMQDKVGRKSADYVIEQFVIDTIAPEITFFNVEEGSAYAKKIEPIVTYSDTNYDFHKGSINWSKDGSNIPFNGIKSTSEKGETFIFKNVSVKAENDGIYTIQAKAIDKAGNETEKTLVYSVNRFGSTFYSEMLDVIQGKYFKEEFNVTLHEVNVTPVRSRTVKLIKNGSSKILEEGKDFTIQVSGGNEKWYEYTYEFNKSLFKEDAKYEINITSVDAAGNVSQTVDEYRKFDMHFYIDKTAPIVQVLNIENNKIYDDVSRKVQISIKDNFKVKEIHAYLNNKKVNIVKEAEDYFVEISEASSKQNLKIEVYDEANNETVIEIKDFVVSSNAFYRFIANKPLFYSTLSLVIALFGGFFLMRKKKEEKTEESE